MTLVIPDRRYCQGQGLIHKVLPNIRARLALPYLRLLLSCAAAAAAAATGVAPGPKHLQQDLEPSKLGV